MKKLVMSLAALFAVAISGSAMAQQLPNLKTENIYKSFDKDRTRPGTYLVHQMENGESYRSTFSYDASGDLDLTGASMVDANGMSTPGVFTDDDETTSAACNLNSCTPKCYTFGLGRTLCFCSCGKKGGLRIGWIPGGAS